MMVDDGWWWLGPMTNMFRNHVMIIIHSPIPIQETIWLIIPWFMMVDSYHLMMLYPIHSPTIHITKPSFRIIHDGWCLIHKLNFFHQLSPSDGATSHPSSRWKFFQDPRIHHLTEAMPFMVSPKKTVVITGASSGLGLAAAKALAEQGWQARDVGNVVGIWEKSRGNSVKIHGSVMRIWVNPTRNPMGKSGKHKLWNDPWKSHGKYR